MSAGSLDAVPDPDLDLDQLAREGRPILVAGWSANALFAVTAIPVALGIDDLIGVAIGVALLLFAVAVGAFVYAFGLGLAGVWAARYGVFPPRPTAVPRRRT